MDAKVLTGKILNGCHLTGFLVGSILEDLKCLIRSGVPQNATFERTGDVVTTGGTFVPNEVVTLGGKMYHHGQVTDTIPSYDVSPLVRPTAPDVYDTCGSQPNPDKHGLNWEFSDPKNAWAWDLLDGVADGVEHVDNTSLPDLLTNCTVTKIPGGYELTTVSDGSVRAENTLISPVVDGTRCSLRFKWSANKDSFIGVNISGGGTPKWGVGDTPVNLRFICGVDNTFALVSESDLLAGEKISLVDYFVTELTPANGTLNIKGMSVVPSVTEWQTVGDFNLLSGATGNQILYIESGTGLICATDGTNTTKSVQPYVAGQDHTVSLAFGDSKMQIYLDGVNGTQVPFVGTFTPGETLKWGLNNEDIFSISSVCGQTTSSFSESVHLAEELAYDL